LKAKINSQGAIRRTIEAAWDRSPMRMGYADEEMSHIAVVTMFQARVKSSPRFRSKLFCLPENSQLLLTAELIEDKFRFLVTVAKLN
jgi:hypothetical protein